MHISSMLIDKNIIKGSRRLVSFAGASIPLYLVAISNTIANFLLYYSAFKFFGAEKFGEYRLFFSVIAFSGFFHLGYIDGLFQYWMVKNENAKLIHIVHVIFISFISLIGLMLLPIKFIDPWIILPTVVFLNLNALLNNIIIKSGIYFSGMLTTLFIHLAALIYLYVTQETLTIKQFTTIYLILTIISTLVLFIYCHNKNLFSDQFNIKHCFSLEYKYFTNGIPILLSGLLFISFFNLDKILLVKTSDPFSFGHFALASSIVSVLFSVLGAPVNLIFSKLLNVTSTLVTSYYNTIFFIIYFCAIILTAISINTSPRLFDIFQLEMKLVPFFNNWIGLLFPLLFLQLIIFNLFKKNNLQVHFSMLAFLMMMLLFALFTFFKHHGNVLMFAPVIISIIIALTTFFAEIILIKSNAEFDAYKKTRWLALATYSLLVFIFYKLNENA